MLKKLHLYWVLMRFHRPIGIYLLLWPTLWALWLVNQGMPSIKLLFIFIVGAMVMRAAGCVINDIADRNFDRFVERTKTRPLTQGDVSLKEALGIFAILAAIAFVLVLQLNLLSILLSFVALACAIVYPFTKRFTYFPQIILGIAFAMAVPIAYAASINYLPLTCWLVFGLAVLWPLMYDTAYAITDYDDDIKIGIKSTAVWFQGKSTKFIGMLQIVLTAGFISLGWYQNLHWTYWLSIIVVVLLFRKQQQMLKQAQPFKAFLNNQWVGCTVWLGIALSFWR